MSTNISPASGSSHNSPGTPVKPTLATKTKVETKTNVERPGRFLFDCVALIAVGTVCYLLAQGQSSAQISNFNKQLKLSGKKIEDANATFIAKSSQLAEDKVTLTKENAELKKQNAELKKQLEYKQALPPETPPTTNNLGKTGLKPTPTRTSSTEVPDLPTGRVEPVPPKGKKDVQLEYVKFKAQMELLLELSRDENIGHSVVDWAALLNSKASEKLKDDSQVQQIEELFLQVGQIAPPQIEGEETRNLIDLLRIHPTGNDVVDDAVNDVLFKRVNNLEEHS